MSQEIEICLIRDRQSLISDAEIYDGNRANSRSYISLDHLQMQIFIMSVYHVTYLDCIHTA